MAHNFLLKVPVSVLSAMTALKTIDVSYQQPPGVGMGKIRVTASLLPILHPGLVKLDLQRRPAYGMWDAASWVHLRCALDAVKSREPIPMVLY